MLMFWWLFAAPVALTWPLILWDPALWWWGHPFSIEWRT
jgi:hypothetical protein